MAKMKIVNRLSEVRRALGLNQTEASFRAGLHVSQLSRYENQHSNFISLAKLAKIMQAYEMTDFNDVFVWEEDDE